MTDGISRPLPCHRVSFPLGLSMLFGEQAANQAPKGQADHGERDADGKHDPFGRRPVRERDHVGEPEGKEVAEKIAGLGSMQAIAEALGTTVSTSDNVTFASLTSQGLDPKFIGAISVAEPGTINGPLTGNIGVYVYKVTAHDTGAFFTEDDAKTRDAQMAQYSSQMLLPVMMQDADVKDNRARFY